MPEVCVKGGTHPEIQTDMTTPVGSAPPSNTPPTISAMGAQTINEDTVTGAIGFTVGDAETVAGSLTVSGRSSNTVLVPPGNLVFGGGWDESHRDAYTRGQPEWDGPDHGDGQ